MNRRSSFSLPRALCAVVMMLAWLAISNHCALGSLIKNAGSPQAHTRCCGGSAPRDGGKVPGSDTRECCKTLHSLPAPTLAKVAKPATNSLADPQVWAVATEVLRAQPAREVEVLDSGPPAARSFAEAVLQRSLLSHAPPSAV